MKAEISQNRSFLMGIAMIGVVLFHHDWCVIPGMTAISSRFGLWGVDVFLFLSGFGCVYALDKYTTFVFLRRRVSRLLPTCLIAGIAVFCADFYFHAERVLTYLPIRIISLHRWYIQCILIAYILCPLAYMFMKRNKAIGLWTMIALAIIVERLLPAIPVWKINWAFGRIPVFLIGMYIAMFDLKMSRWQYIVSGLCFMVAIFLRGILGAPYWTFFLAIAMPFVCETLCRLRNICLRLKIYGFIELIGMYSFEIYLIHEYSYWALYKVSIPLWSKYVIFLFAVPILCYVVKGLSNGVSRIFDKCGYIMTKKL